MESLMNTPERITLNFPIEHDGVPYQYLVAPAGGYVVNASEKQKDSHFVLTLAPPFASVQP